MSKYSALPDLDTAPDVYVSDGPSVDGVERSKQIDSLRSEIELLANDSDDASDEDREDASPPTKTEGPPSDLLAQILTLSNTVEKVQPSSEGHWGFPTLASLASEVDSLTRLVGMADPLVATPLAASIATLQHQVALLTQPRQLDAVTRRLKTLAPHADDAPSASAAMQPPDDGKQETPHLASLLRAQSRLEPLLPLPTALLARMRSLASVHAHAAAVRASLATAGDEVALLAQRERQINHLAAQLQEAMRANAAVQRGNYVALAQRADRLGARVAALSGRQPLPPLVAHTAETGPATEQDLNEAQAGEGAAGADAQAAATTGETTKPDDMPEQDDPEPAGELVEE